MNVSEYHRDISLVYLAHRGWSPKDKKGRLKTECELILETSITEIDFWPSSLGDMNRTDAVLPRPWISSPQARYRPSQGRVVHLIEPIANEAGVLYIATQTQRYVVCVAPEGNNRPILEITDESLRGKLASADVFLAYGQAYAIVEDLAPEETPSIGFDPRLTKERRSAFKQCLFIGNNHNRPDPDVTIFLPMPYFNTAYTIRGANRASNEKLRTLYGNDLCLQHSHPLSLFAIALSGRSQPYPMNMTFFADKDLQKRVDLINVASNTPPRALTDASDLQLYCQVRDGFYETFKGRSQVTIEAKVAFVYHALRHRPPVLQKTEDRHNAQALLEDACRQGYRMTKNSENCSLDDTWPMAIEFSLSLFSESSKSFLRRLGRSPLDQSYAQASNDFKDECGLDGLKKHIALKSRKS